MRLPSLAIALYIYIAQAHNRKCGGARDIGMKGAGVSKITYAENAQGRSERVT